ncbi:psbP domain-containing protein 6 chloroplastic-like, partial [Trifolium medium]|nr:psbP domain-containing protein 6 chloroplastic-like [Trifolium medium]
TPRREFLKGIALSLPLIALTEPPHSQARDVAVGSFLPPSSSDPSFVLFKASPKDTPALRAGAKLSSAFNPDCIGSCTDSRYIIPGAFTSMRLRL